MKGREKTTDASMVVVAVLGFSSSVFQCPLFAFDCIILAVTFFPIER